MDLSEAYLPGEVIALITALLPHEQAVRMSALNMSCYEWALRQSSQIAVIKYKGMKNLKWIISKLTNWRQNDIHLMFGPDFDASVENLSEISLTQLTFGANFNQSVEHLPASLTQLTFGFCFNRRVENLPVSLTQLTFGGKFNQPVENLPDSVTIINY